MTFRVGEGEVEVEVLREEPINPSIGEEVDLPTMRSIGTGMLVNQQTPAQVQGEHMRRNHGRSIWRPSKTETLQGTSQESMRIEKELEVPVQEERGPAGGTGAMRGREAGEIIIKRVEETTEETTAKALAEETIAQIGRAGEIIAQDIGKRRADPGVGETTHLRRAEGTLVRTDEGVAQGPLVMEGP